MLILHIRKSASDKIDLIIAVVLGDPVIAFVAVAHLGATAKGVNGDCKTSKSTCDAHSIARGWPVLS